MIKRNKAKRSYNIKKTGVKDEYIDRQILAIHLAIVNKILAEPALGTQVFNTLDARRLEGKIGYGEYITWYSLLEIIDDPDSFKRGVLEYSGKMRKYRRRTPFINILTEEERNNAIQAGAIGELPNISVIF